MISNQEITSVIVDRIKDYLVEKGLTITEFADFVQLPRRTVNSWMLKQRTPRIDYIYHIAECLGYSIDYLVGKEKN